MKKYLATYLLLCSAFLFCACMEDGKEEVTVAPYASLRSFDIKSVNVYSTAKLSNGSDTTLVNTLTGEKYPFVIDQKSRMVYNPDSLPFGADVTKMLFEVSSDGIAYVYSDSSETYELFSSSDSLDFSSPRRLLVAAIGGAYALEYNVKVNVHNVDPDKLAWQKFPSSPIEKPLRLLLCNDKMMLFGCNADGVLQVSETLVGDTVEWSNVVEVATLPQTADVASMLSYNNTLYVVADGCLYSSTDGVEWSNSGVNISALVSASLEDGKMWAVADGNLVYTTDGTAFTVSEPLPASFPVRNISFSSYPLRTNPFITRCLLVGYPEGENSTPAVWSRLSTEERWVHYEYSGDGEYNCPTLNPLTVLHYDDKLYAFGGAGKMGENDVKAFENLYTSIDNGLTWHKSAGTRVQLPDELEDCAAPYAAALDNNSRIWIVSGDTLPMWRGCINRLSFK